MAFGLWLLVCALFIAQAVYTIVPNASEKPVVEKQLRADGSTFNPLDVVLIADTSGPTQFIGKDMAAGFQDAINEAQIGDDVRLVVRDDEGQVAKVAAIAQGSAAGFSTLALFGPTEQQGFQSVRDAATEGMVVALTPVGSSVTSRNGDWTFSLQAGTFKTGFMLGRVLQKIADGSRVVHLVAKDGEQTAFWKGVLEAYYDVDTSLETFDPKQFELVWTKDPGKKTLSKVTGEALPTNVVIISLPAAQAQDALRELRDVGYLGTIVLEGEGSLANFPERFKNEPKELLSEGFYTNGVLSLVPFTPSVGTAESQRLIAGFREAHNADPSWAYAYGYDAGLLISRFVAASKAAGTFSLSNPGATQQALQKFLQQARLEGTKIHGYTGDLSFTATNEREMSPKLVFYHGGAQLPYYLQIGDQPHIKTGLQRDKNEIVVGAESYRVTPVVYVGVTIKDLNSLDLVDGLADITFDLWFKAQTPLNFKDLVFTNAAAEPKLLDSVDEVMPLGGHYQKFVVRGSFRFTPRPADLLLDKASVAIAFRHSKLDHDQFSFVIDPEVFEAAAPTGGNAAAQGGDNGFKIVSSVVGVADMAQDATGDPRAVHGQITYSVGSYHADLRRATSSLTSRFITVLGQTVVQTGFIALLAAMMALTFLNLVRPRLVLQMAIGVVFIGVLMFSQGALFTLPVAYTLRVQVIEVIKLAYDVAMVSAVVRVIDLGAVAFLNRTGAVRDIQPVILFIMRFAIYLAGVSFFYVSILGRDLLPVLATASVLLTVVGLALRELIFDAVAGIAIAADEHFRIGQWVNLRARERTVSGMIIDLGWRFVRVRSRDMHVHDVPNSVVATQVISHLSISSTRVEIPFVMSAKVSADLVFPDIAAALEDALKNLENVDHARRPRLLIDGLEDDRMRCMVHVYVMAEQSTDQVRTVVLDVVRHSLEKADAMSHSIILPQRFAV